MIQCSNVKELLDDVHAVYDPHNAFDYELTLSDNSAEFGTHDKGNSLTIFLTLQPSDLTKAIVKLCKAVQCAIRSRSAKFDKRSMASHRRHQPEQADAIRSQVDIDRSIGSTVPSLHRNPVSSPSPAASTPSRISDGLPASSSSVPIVRDTAVDTTQVPTDSSSVCLNKKLQPKCVPSGNAFFRSVPVQTASDYGHSISSGWERPNSGTTSGTSNSVPVGKLRSAYDG